MTGRTKVRVRDVRARYCGLLLLCAAFVTGAAGQKPTHPELKQLQGPQNPRIGFMIQVGGKEHIDDIRALLSSARTSLLRGTAASTVARNAMRTLEKNTPNSRNASLISLDKRGRLASLVGGRIAGSSLCAASSLTNDSSALTVCSDVVQRALTLQGAVDAFSAKQPTAAVIAMDKFGNMALTSNPGLVTRAYIGADGKTVVEVSN